RTSTSRTSMTPSLSKETRIFIGVLDVVETEVVLITYFLSCKFEIRSYLGSVGLVLDIPLGLVRVDPRAMFGCYQDRRHEIFSKTSKKVRQKPAAMIGV